RLAIYEKMLMSNGPNHRKQDVKTNSRMPTCNDNRELSLRICLHTIWPIKTLFVGGTERFIIDTAKALKRYGFDVFVLCSNTTYQTEIEGVDVFGCIPRIYQNRLTGFENNPNKLIKEILYGEDSTINSIRSLNEFVRLQLQEYSFDIVHLNTFSASLFDDIPQNAILTIHENPEELDTFWHDGAFAELARFIQCGDLKLPRFTFAPSRHYAREYSKYFGQEVFPNPIGVPWTNIGDIGSRKQKRGNRILLPARLFPQQKGQNILIEALGLLKSRGRSFNTTLTGADDRYIGEAKILQNRLNKLNLRSEVHIKQTNSIEVEFQNHDILVSPEQYCSYGISIREAAAMGLKLVLSNIPPHHEIEYGSLNIQYFEKNSITQCADAIESAYLEPETPIEKTLQFRLKSDFDEFAKRYAQHYLDLRAKSI
ncbi:glycosyltransferase family 4 protein, partial [Roseibium sp. HPY-6]|uniref:glycosyltransferase family 4 protein n=1 Tax=Roseibium sp. HPY-6 TaxID=3229852 RepID=UPI00338F7C78